jgi:hypothetical protein
MVYVLIIDKDNDDEFMKNLHLEEAYNCFKSLRAIDRDIYNTAGKIWSNNSVEIRKTEPDQKMARDTLERREQLACELEARLNHEVMTRTAFGAWYHK